MKAIVTDKFIQNPQLQEKLLLTGAKTLIEATTDPFWGAGVIMGSKILAKGKWKGSNHLGVILGEVREDLKRSETWLNFQLPESDDEPSISSESTNTESLSADIEPMNESHGNDSMISNPRLSSVTVRRGKSGSKKRSKKQKKKNAQSSVETPILHDQTSSPGPPLNSAGSPSPLSSTLFRGGPRGRGRGRGSTPSKQSITSDPLVGASLSGQTTGKVALCKTGSSTSDHSRAGLRTDCSSQLLDSSFTGTFYGQDLEMHSAHPSLGMYLSSVSHWNTGSYDIPQQFLTSLEPPYRLAMGNRIPLYSVYKGSDSNLARSSVFTPTAYDSTTTETSFGLNANSGSSSSRGVVTDFLPR